MSTTVVVAHNSNAANLRRWRAQRWPNHTVIVDTGSTPEMIEDVLRDSGGVAPAVIIDQTPYRGYDTGAYLWAYYRHVGDNFLFLQDSITPRDKDFVEQFHALMPKDGLGAVAWVGFDFNLWDTSAQRDAVMWMYQHPKSLPTYGIFGPIFYTSRKALDRLADMGLLPSHPLHKEGQQAMERAWALAFFLAGMPVKFMVKEHDPRRDDMAAGKYPVLTKTFVGRS